MNTRDMVYVALFAAIFAALGLMPPIPLPFVPVPITAQTLGVMLAGSLLGARRGGLAILLAVVLAAIGAPILAGGRGGFGVIMGPTGGFVLGFPVAAFVIGYMVEKGWQRLNVGTAFAYNAVGGILVLYLIGVPWLSFVAGMPLLKAISVSAAFIPGDLIKAALAAYIAVTVKRAYPLIARA